MRGRYLLRGIVVVALALLLGGIVRHVNSQSDLPPGAIPHRNSAVLSASSPTLFLPLLLSRYPPPPVLPERPVLLPIDNPDGDGDYTVRWQAAVWADTYELEEQWQGEGWMAIYTGTATQLAITHRPPGIYEYRVRARNSWGQSEWSDVQAVTVAGDPPGQFPQPPSQPEDGGGMAVVQVVNDCPFALRLDFAGPDPHVLTLPRCEVCHVYDNIGPTFCPTENRPVEEIRLVSGTYRVFVTVEDASVSPYVGHWELEGDRGYFVCFYVVRRWKTEHLASMTNSRIREPK